MACALKKLLVWSKREGPFDEDRMVGFWFSNVIGDIKNILNFLKRVRILRGMSEREAEHCGLDLT